MPAPAILFWLLAFRAVTGASALAPDTVLDSHLRRLLAPDGAPVRCSPRFAASSHLWERDGRLHVRITADDPADPALRGAGLEPRHTTRDRGEGWIPASELATFTGVPGVLRIAPSCPAASAQRRRRRARRSGARPGRRLQRDRRRRDLGRHRHAAGLRRPAGLCRRRRLGGAGPARDRRDDGAGRLAAILRGSVEQPGLHRLGLLPARRRGQVVGQSRDARVGTATTDRRVAW